MEGVVLYVVLVQVFVKRQRLYMLAFALLSYGELICCGSKHHKFSTL